MTQRTEDDEIIDTALDTLAWQRREIDHLTAERDNAAKAERDRIVAWLRLENGRCDCAALERDECACGAWDDYKQWSLNHTADLIEAGEHLQ